MRPFGQIGDGEIPPEWGWPEVDRGMLSGGVGGGGQALGIVPGPGIELGPADVGDMPKAVNLRPVWDDLGWGDDILTFPASGWPMCFPLLYLLIGDDGKTAVRALVETPTGSYDFDPAYPSLLMVNPIGDSNPGTDRIMLALSSDGVTWRKTGLVVVEHGGVPCLAVDGSTLYLFCVASVDGPSGEKFITTAFVCASTDDLMSWKYSKPFVNFPVPLDPTDAGDTFTEEVTDPSVVARASGTGWYLYFTAQRGRVIDGVDTWTGGSTFIADAFDLASMQWNVRGTQPVWPPLTSTLSALDPNVLHVTTAYGSYYQYFAGSNGVKDLWLSESDGVTITGDNGQWLDTVAYPGRKNSVEAIMTNGADVNGGYNWYAQAQNPDSDPRPAVIFGYYWSEYGAAWSQRTATPTLEVTETYESTYVMDAAVVKFGNCYVMAYVTRIPPGVPEGGFGVGAP